MGIIIAGRRIMEQLKANHTTHVVVEILLLRALRQPTSTTISIISTLTKMNDFNFNVKIPKAVCAFMCMSICKCQVKIRAISAKNKFLIIYFIRIVCKLNTTGKITKKLTKRNTLDL